MILKTIRQKLIRKTIEKHCQNRSPLYAEQPIRSIAVVVNGMEVSDLSQFDGLEKRFNILKKDLKIIYYSESKNNLPSLMYDKFASKDFSWKGDIQNGAVKEFLDRKYDVLIGYYSERNHYLDLVAARTEASLKVGVENADERLFDLIFNVKTSDYPSFEKELAGYLNIIFNNNKA